MKWTIPTRVVERGRRYVEQGRVLRVYADSENNRWSADVLGTKEYHISLDGSPMEEDICDCPYWINHHYCKHTVAVELYLKKNGLNRILEKNPIMLLPRRKVVQPLDILKASLSKFPKEKTQRQTSQLQPLRIEYLLKNLPTNKYHPEMDVLALSLKIGLLREKKTRLIKNLREFLLCFSEEREYALDEKQSYLLTHENFDEETVEQLLQMKNTMDSQEIYSHTLGASSKKTDARYCILPKEEGKQWLNRLLQRGELTVEIDGVTKETLVFSKQSLPLHLFVSKEEENYLLQLPDTKGRIFSFYQWLVVGEIVYDINDVEIEKLNILKHLKKQLGTEVVTFQGKEKNLLFSEVLPKLETFTTVHLPENIKNDFVLEAMQPTFIFKKNKTQLQASIDFRYGTEVFSTDKRRELLSDRVVIRKTAEEEALREQFLELGFSENELGFAKPFENPFEILNFFRFELPQFRKLGKVLLGKKLSAMYIDASKHPIQLEVEEKRGWLDVHFNIEGIEEEEVNRIVQQMLDKQTFATLSNGTLINLESEEYIKVCEILQNLRDGAKVKKGHLVLPKSKSLELARNLEQQQGVQLAEDFQTLVYDLGHPFAIDYQPSNALQATLRRYQTEGVKWMKTLSKHHFGGVLADEMGLGKTIQTLSFLLNEKEEGSGEKSIILAPASLIYNWQSECEKFTPSLRSVVVAGTQAEREKILSNVDEVDVLITSYSTFRSDASIYSNHAFDTLILDEAQTVKNAATKTSQSIRKLSVGKTFALSGTPIENNADELWSIFSLLLPGLLPSKQKMKTLPTAEIHKIISPFLLRREKKEVLRDLSEKVESNLYSPLTVEQKKVYLAYLKQMNAEVAGMSNAEVRKNKISILAGLTRLRQICDDPKLFMDDYEGGSGKLEQLLDLLQVAKENGRRVLVFSQFTSMLSIIEEELSRIGFTSFYLRGSTKVQDRLTMVEAFNAGEKDVFLISLKAGGTGLNLTGADTVILYDLWWNPAVEEQAAGRAHRIGQTKNVEVWRMISKGTVEERIQQLQSEKRELFASIIQGQDPQSSALTEEELRMILQAGLEGEES